MLRKIFSMLPPGLIRYFGTLQFKMPFLRPLILRVAASATSGEGVIQRGVGQGLKFDATGGYPGYQLGTTEPVEQELLASVLKEGKVFYDLGANIGFYGVLAARLVGPSGHVYMFEPFEPSVKAIQKNMGLNGFTNYTVEQVAVSNESGEISLGMGDNSAKHSIEKAQDSGESSFRVKSVSIQDYIQQNNARLPDVIMIDIEGAEIMALEGMLGVLEKAKPVILCEVHWLGDAFPDFVEKKIVPLGYKVTTYEGGELSREHVRFHAVMRPISPRV